MNNKNNDTNYYNKFINVNRLRKSEQTRRRIEEFYSDKSRIIYSSSFRRLQQKAQVFSLEPNASVRTRLTHSLEVSDLGRTLANKIAYCLVDKKKLKEDNVLSLVAIVENSCLLHDIGNPPFGHFGEAAIKEWAKDIKDCLPPKTNKDNDLLNELITDFMEFDGNPQGLRIVTKLHPDFDEYSLNLTYSTLLCMLKYPRTPSKTQDNKKIFKKAGYFHTEKKLVEDIYESISLTKNHRYPFVYIMEAADDIAYCMSDIADGIEKGIITEEKFLNEFRKEWETVYKNEPIPVVIPENSNLKGFKQDISIPWSIKAIDEAVSQFITLDNKIYDGTAGSLISEETSMGKVLETMKSVSRRILYTSFEAESIEISGYAVMTGILNEYKRILKMEYTNFKNLIENKNIKEFDFEKRLIHFIGKRYIKAYEYEIKKYENDDNFDIREWWLRAHLIIDHISGMTDEYALQTYQMLKGISLMR